ncbi:MAG: peptidylprolyl isomerase [Deltaproteobacteria bacterium]|nr:peptidylprolyl isomerase [Deltaproteobacteria bacterium]
MPELASDVTDATWGVADVVGATVATDKGVIGLALYPQVAPATVASFVSLAESAAYEGLLFHRVVPDFVVQGGDPDGTGWGGPGYTLRDEFSAIPYRRGTLGMARAGLNTAGSQWFVTHSPQPHLEGHYTVFGQVNRGMDVVDSLRRGDRILSVEIRRRSP